MGTEVIPQQRTNVITGKYFIQYTFSAGGSAAAVPMIDGMGTGLTFTICLLYILASIWLSSNANYRYCTCYYRRNIYCTDRQAWAVDAKLGKKAIIMIQKKVIDIDGCG